MNESINGRAVAHGLDDALNVGEREPFEVLGVGHRRVRAGDAADGGVQIVEGALHDLRADLGGDAAEGVRLFGDDDAVRLLHRVDDGLDVERADGARVNDLDRDALTFQLLGGLQGERHGHRARDDGRVRPFALHVGAAQRDEEVFFLRHFALEAVHALLFEEDDGVVVFLEQERMYGLKGEVPEEEDFLIPLGRADVKREGTDATIVARSMTVPLALKAAEELEGQGVSVEVVDPRTIRPLDIETIVNSVKKTNRVVIAEESHPFCGVAAEISAQIMERAFDYLDAPVRRVSGADAPMPYAKNLERLALPDVERIVEAVREVSYMD